MIKDPKEKAKKCNQEIQASLNKHNCRIISTPTFKTDSNGYLKVGSEIKIAPLVKIIKPSIKPKKKNGETKYIN